MSSVFQPLQTNIINTEARDLKVLTVEHVQLLAYDPIKYGFLNTTTCFVFMILHSGSSTGHSEEGKKEKCTTKEQMRSQQSPPQVCGMK